MPPIQSRSTRTRAAVLVSSASASDPDPAYIPGSMVLVRPSGIKLIDSGTQAQKDNFCAAAGLPAGCLDK